MPAAMGDVVEDIDGIMMAGAMMASNVDDVAFGQHSFR